ncbi:MAG: Eco29kI family restriction endonuclease [Anaerolineae bacterium]
MEFEHKRHVFHSRKFRSVVDEAIRFFTVTPAHKLPPPSQFIGAGVYGLYYLGDYELYAKIARLNKNTCIQPIYVGKAVPPGWRTARTVDTTTPDLYRRLREHTRSIQQAKNLEIGDFRCRFMILTGIESDLVVPVEAELIRRYKPLWNTVIDGFGNHDPGAGRYNQARSEWDVLHPGRPWAARLTGESPRLEDVIAKVQGSLA